MNEEDIINVIFYVVSQTTHKHACMHTHTDYKY